jgi:hypothetical protein
MRRTALTLMAVWALAPWGCSDTVGFVALTLDIPDYETPIICDADPRRITSLTLTARCESGPIEETFEVKRGEGLTASLGGVPLERCSFSVAADNTHGRTVLTGESEILEITNGSNEAVTVLLSEADYDDGDGDGLATTDEKGLQLDPSLKDSDDNGINDDVEVLECCTWPAGGQKQCRGLFINSVELTEYGPEGETVLVKASKALSKPSVTLGGAPLASAIPDSTLVFGKVGKGAVLGKLELSSGTEKATFKRLYGVLRQDEELLPELDQKAGASIALMQQAVDLAYAGDSLLLLGRTTGSAATVQAPALLRVDLARDALARQVLGTGDRPVALAVASSWVVVLVAESSGRGRLLLYTIEPSGSLRFRRATTLLGTNPVDMLMEPSGDMVQVLFYDRLTRVRLAPFPLPLAIRSITIFPVPDVHNLGVKQVSRCTGLVYHEPTGTAAGRGMTYIGCNFEPASCPAGQTCPGRPGLLQLGPVANCMAKTNPAPVRDPCWVYWLLATPLPAAGAPVVDDTPSRKKVYLMTSGRILEADLDAQSTAPLRKLTDLISFSRRGKTTAAPLMTLDGSGYLYAVNGDRVHRLEPRQQKKNARLGKEVKLSEFKEEAWMLAPSPDGSLLSVIKRRGAGLHSLMSLCLRRCSTCLCQ